MELGLGLHPRGLIKSHSGTMNAFPSADPPNLKKLTKPNSFSDLLNAVKVVPEVPMTADVKKNLSTERIDEVFINGYFG